MCYQRSNALGTLIDSGSTAGDADNVSVSQKAKHFSEVAELCGLFRSGMFFGPPQASLDRYAGNHATGCDPDGSGRVAVSLPIDTGRKSSRLLMIPRLRREIQANVMSLYGPTVATIPADAQSVERKGAFVRTPTPTCRAGARAMINLPHAFATSLSGSAPPGKVAHPAFFRWPSRCQELTAVS